MNLNINYALTKQTGENLKNKGEEFASLLNRVKSYNQQLSNAWKGTDASKYNTAVEMQSEDMQKLVQATREIGEFLVKVGVAYEQARDTNAGNITGI